MSIGFDFTVIGGYKQGSIVPRYYLNLRLGNGYKAYVFHRKPVPLFYIEVKIQFRDNHTVKEFLRAQRCSPTVGPF